MRRLVWSGLLMLAGAFGGYFLVDANQWLGAAMGAVLGATFAVVALAFPMDIPNSDSFFRD